MSCSIRKTNEISNEEVEVDLARIANPVIGNQFLQRVESEFENAEFVDVVFEKAKEKWRLSSQRGYNSSSKILVPSFQENGMHSRRVTRNSRENHW